MKKRCSQVKGVARPGVVLVSVGRFVYAFWRHSESERVSPGNNWGMKKLAQSSR